MTEQALLDALAAHTLELDGTAPDQPGDLGWLGDRLGDAEIVGLGEATHGTREFVQLKHRLLRRLVAETGTRALCLEAGFAETRAVDRYVTDGEGSASDALASLRGWSWAVEEMESVLDWLRQFNADRPREDRVRVYGLDAQYTTDAVAQLRSFLQMVDLQYADSIRADLDSVDDDGALLGRRVDHRRRVETADQLLPALRERLADDRQQYIDATSREAYRFAQGCLDHVERAVAYKRAVRAVRRGEDHEKAAARPLRRRDHAMAATVEWVREDHTRIALWAHDAHLNRSGQHARQGQAREEPVCVPSLGSRLAERYGDQYLAVGFAFGRGEFRAITEIVEPSEPRHVRRLQRHSRDEPDPGTIAATLAALGVAVAVVDLRRAREDDRLSGWLADSRPHFSVGVTYDENSPATASTEYVSGEAFDVLCYVDRTTPTRPLD